MTRKTHNKNGQGLGKAILNEKTRQKEKKMAEADRLEAKLAVGLCTGGSVLEQTCLDDLIATVELKKEAWADDVGEAEFVAQGPTLLSYGDPNATLAAERAASDRRDLVSIPRRPQWREGMSVDELAEKEAEAFMDWRRGLAQAAQEEGLYLTPYERNLDFWRQLWRCIERSDLLVQIVDARDPDFYHCRDLGRYVEELGGNKRLMILVNKADFMTEEHRRQWVLYFESKGIDAVFFSALREVRRQNQGQQQPRARQAEEDEEEQHDEEEEEEASAAAAAGEAAAAASAGANERRSPQRGSVFTRVGLEDDAEDDEAEAPTATAAASEAAKAPAAAPPVDGALVPIPDSDEDDDLAEEGEKPAEEEGKRREEAKDEEEDEEEPPLGPGADDELPGVLDSTVLLDELVARLPEPADDEAAPRSCSASMLGAALRRGTIGFVGYPNVGKSTVINALVGSKRVGMSRTPGKTKHIQTLELQSLGVTLCDCPGLVFPSVAATKAHLVINNTVHIDDLRECFSPIALIVEKIGMEQILKRYDCAAHVRDARARSGDHVLDDTHAFLAAFAVSRNHFLRVGVPDENWAARKVLKDYVSGALLHCEEPPTSSGSGSSSAPPPSTAAAPEAAAAAAPGEQEERPSDGEGSEQEPAGDGDDFGDLEAWLRKARGGNGGRGERNMTKRRMRHLNKQLLRGRQGAGAVESAGYVGVHSAVCHGAGGGAAVGGSSGVR